MPVQILKAYARYVEKMKVYNSIGGAIGHPYTRRCGIPQGCPFSMMLVALIMRPWICLMEKLQAVPNILADDVFLLMTGPHMLKKNAEALNQTHEYLQTMGARIAPAKSFNFASSQSATKWLAETWWDKIQNTIDTCKDFRYLGAHLSTRLTTTSATLKKRMEEARVQQNTSRHDAASTSATRFTV